MPSAPWWLCGWFMNKVRSCKKPPLPSGCCFMEGLEFVRASGCGGDEWSRPWGRTSPPSRRPGERGAALERVCRCSPAQPVLGVGAVRRAGVSEHHLPHRLHALLAPIRGGTEIGERDGNGGRRGRGKKTRIHLQPLFPSHWGSYGLRSREPVVKAGGDCLSQHSPLTGSTCWQEAAVTCCPQGWLHPSWAAWAQRLGWGLGGALPCPGVGSGASHLASCGPPLEIFRNIRGQINPQENFPSTTKIQNYIF